MANRTITYGSLFTGVGGMDLGFDRAHMVCKWQVEIDEYANTILNRRWPDVPKHRDIRGCGSHNLDPIDVICGGFPCQPHSNAGLRGGSTDNRDLWPEYLRLIAELKPKWVVGENVPGIATSALSFGSPTVEYNSIARYETHDIYKGIFSRSDQLYLNSIHEDLENLGYTVALLNIPAIAYGAPHLRYRIIIVAHTKRQ